MIQESKRWKRVYHTATNSYFMYQGRRWNLSDFMTMNHHDEWDAYLTLTNTSAMLIKLSNCGEAVKTAISY